MLDGELGAWDQGLWPDFGSATLWLLMTYATVHELKARTSELLRKAAREDVIITSRGRPVARLVGLQPDDLSVRPGIRGPDYADDRQRQEVLLLLARIWKIKPDKGKTWILQNRHDLAPYGGQ